MIAGDVSREFALLVCGTLMVTGFGIQAVTWLQRRHGNPINQSSTNG